MTRTGKNSRNRSVAFLARRGLLALIATWLIAGVSATAAEVSKEYQVKAAFLLNFAQFIQWPATAFATPEAPIVIGVLGEDPFGSALDQTLEGESINGRQLVVKRSQKIEDLKICQMVFIATGEKDRLADIMKAVHDTSIVTVGETDQFVKSGGNINLYMENGKTRFEINTDEAQRKGLKVNSQLLKRAKAAGSSAGK
jgi:hypothetical protein